MALMTIELQRLLPNARVVYMSATGATQVSNLAYAERLGLWGEGTEFANRDAFVNGVAAGGVAAMELVARDMKAGGMYTSRTLSFKGVSYKRLTHTLTPDQVQMYDALAEAWQVALKNINAALELTGADGKVDGKQRSRAIGRFWNAHQAFFNQVLTAMQMPSVLAQLKADIAAGKAPVLSIVNTGAAPMERATKKAAAEAAERGEELDLDDIDITPRDAITEMVKSAFPVSQMESVTEDGVTTQRPVMDSNGKPVLNQQAVKMRDELLRKLEEVRVPDTPIDQIIEAFGPSRVAEVTGRKSRYVRGKNGKRVKQDRTDAAVADDIRAFMNGERDLLIFSQKGATGASYHADNKKKNRKQREFYMLQAGWRADKAVQSLGRVHRSDQAIEPEFLLVETSLPGHRRFISTIARRLEQLGALSRGQRTAGGGGLFSEADNLESSHAQDALFHLLNDVTRGAVDGVTAEDFESQTGLKLTNDTGDGDTNRLRGVEVRQFLNRLLSLKVDLQGKVFDAYADRLERQIEAARQNGTLDTGMETIKAEKIEKVAERVVRKDKISGAETRHVELKVFQPSERHAFDDVTATVERAEKQRPTETESLGRRGGRFWRNSKSGQSYMVAPAGELTDEKGRQVRLVARWGPRGKTIMHADKLYSTHVRAYEDEVRGEWNETLSNMPKLEEHRVHMITGALLPVWNRLPKDRPRVRRATTDAGERFLGRVVDEDDLSETLGNLGVERKFEVPAAAEARDVLLTGGQIEFGNGWRLVRKKIRDEAVFEITDLRFGEGGLLEGMGARRTPVGAGKARYFLPVGADSFGAIYDRLVKGYEVVRVLRGNEDERMYAPDDDPDPPGGGRGRVAASSSAGDVQAVEVIDLIESQWKVAVRGPATFRRQFKVERALGWYTPALGEMRFRVAHDVVTAIHELGHHFDRELGKWSAKRDLPASIQAELRQLGEDLYGAGSKPSAFYKSEGFGEFIREWLTGAASLPQRAPTLHAWFATEYLPEHPEEARKIAKLQDAVRLLLTQTPQQAMDAFQRPTEKDWSAERIAGAAQSVIDEKFRDATLPLLRAMQETGADLSKVAPHEHPYILATHLARSAGGRVKHAALEGTVDVYGRVTGAGLKQVLQPVLAQGDERTNELFDYMIALRALGRYHAHGLDPGLSKADAEAIVREHDDKPHFREVAQAFTDFADRALEPLVQSGRMTEAQRAKIRRLNPIYVPFMRRFEGTSTSSARGGQGEAVHRVTKRGSKLPIHDVLDAMLEQYERIQQVAMQHEVMRSMVVFYDEQRRANRAGKPETFLARFMSEIPPSVEAVKFRAGQVSQPILDVLATELDEEAFAKAEEALEEFWHERLTVFRRRSAAPKTGAGEDPAIAITVNGRRRFFQVRPELIPILEGVAHSTFLPGTLGAIVRGATSLTRLGATGLNPTFAIISNTVRDATTATITADYSFQVPILSTLHGMLMDVTGDEYATRYHAAGLGINSMIGQDMDAAARLSARVRHGSLRAALSSPRDFVDAVRDVLSHSEIGPRLIEFKAAYDAGVERWGEESPAALVLAGAASKDLTVNFTRAGSWSRQANEVVPFFNAAVQSLDKLARSLGVAEPAPWASSQSRLDALRRTAGRSALLLTTTAVIAWLMHRDDDDWKELPAQEKWSFLHVWKLPGGSWVRLPLPFEAGALFGALPIAMLEEQRSPGALREALGVAFLNATPFDFSSLHAFARNAAIAAPIVDVIANKDWKGDPILTTRKDMLAEDKIDPRTTTLARWLAPFTPGSLSPIELDHIFNGYSGGLWRRVFGSGDTLAAMRGDVPSSWPVLGVLFTRPQTSRLVGDFYDRMQHLKERKGSKVATFEEIGELATAERLDRDLDALWDARRSTIASDRPKADVERDAGELLDRAQDLIREHNRRDSSRDRSAGIGNALYRLTAPLPERPTEAQRADFEARQAELAGLGLAETEAVAALRDEARRRMDNAKARTATGGWTAYGRRLSRLLRALRNRQPAAPSSASGS